MQNAVAIAITTQEIQDSTIGNEGVIIMDANSVQLQKKRCGKLYKGLPLHHNKMHQIHVYHRKRE